MSRSLKTIYDYHYQGLKEQLKQVQWLSVTLDFWSNRKNQSFLCITGHWYTDSIDPVSKVIDFSLFENRHTGIEISKAIKEKMIALNIYEKIVCITCDGAENMVLACELLDGNFTRIWCYAHRLHLVVINALGFWLSEKKMISDSTVQVSTAARTINSTNSLSKTSSISASTTTSSTSASSTSTSTSASSTTTSNGTSSTTNSKTAFPTTNTTTTTESKILVTFDDEDENAHMDIDDIRNHVMETSKFTHFVHIFIQ